MKKTANGTEYKITHTMADGRVLDSIDGYKVPVNEKTKIAYDLLASFAIRSIKKQKN